MSHVIKAYIVRTKDYPLKNAVLPAYRLNLTEYKIISYSSIFVPQCDYVFVETNYFGGFGDQDAYICQSGRITKPTKDFGQINEMLKLFGVIREDDKDEFDTIGLGKYRDMDDFDPDLY